MNRHWNQYPTTFRRREMEIISNWIEWGRSGCVLGLAGSGKSNLLRLICSRPEIVLNQSGQSELKAFLIPLDLNDMPSRHISVFYRSIIRSFYEHKDRLAPELSEAIQNIFEGVKHSTDPFLCQTEVRHAIDIVLTHFDRLVFVFDRFDDFCEIANLQMINSLKGFRDKYKGKISFIFGMKFAATYLDNPEKLGEIYSILDTQSIWIGALNFDNSRVIILQEVDQHTLNKRFEVLLFELSGGYPSLLQLCCQLLPILPKNKTKEESVHSLLKIPSVLNRVKRILSGLTQEELMLLQDREPPSNNHVEIAEGLVNKGIFRKEADSINYSINGMLLARYVFKYLRVEKGGISFDQQKNAFFQGKNTISNLSPLEFNLLYFFFDNPYVRHTKTTIINQVWEEEAMHGISDESLYQVISGLRKKLETSMAQSNFIVSWRGRPEGGYQFFPEGRPNQIEDSAFK